ncbi:TonB-dependent receptor [Rubritalea tangerina]|uniref:TonB-dependent receptor n=1 Tax=Rubritalea tangerina TaxID=430798 RepID=A0ABW4ZF67_9BACT
MKCKYVAYVGLSLGAQLAVAHEAENSPSELHTLDPTVVTGKAENLLGEAQTASRGQSDRKELLERPYLRRGEILEVIPGMVVTQHAGGGKANQYFVRGYNLDHGVDFGLFVDGMPANYRAHGHGQGYADLNFLIPEFIEQLDYTKGPFYAELGDLTTAGSAQFSLVNSLQHSFAKFEIGQDNYWRGVFGDSVALAGGLLTYGGEYNYYDGPWQLKQNAKRGNGILRWHRGDENQWLNATFMAYGADWRSSDQIPSRAVASGALDRYGYIDPSNGGDSQRYSLSFNMGNRQNDVFWRAKGYVGYYDLDLYSNFTYLLDDPDNGDQFRQTDNRIFFGGEVSSTFEDRLLFGHETDYLVGFQTHNDYIWDLALTKTSLRNDLNNIRRDDVFTGNYALFASANTRWNDWFRTEMGLRGELFYFDVASNLAANSGDKIDGIVVPKLNMIFGPWDETEYYLNLGGGFHSNDARGVTINVDPVTGLPTTGVDPLVRTWGSELGLRSHLLEDVTATVALWWIYNDSELLYVGDAGNVEAGPSTNRYGIEVATYWRPSDWFTFDAEVSVAEGRYEDPSLTDGPWVENQVPVVVSSGIVIGEEIGWFGALRGRYFSERPLTADKSVEARASFQVNARAGYRTERWELALDVLNLLDRKDNDIEYYYTSRLAGEPADGVDDTHFHPAEPLTVRANFTWWW